MPKRTHISSIKISASMTLALIATACSEPREVATKDRLDSIIASCSGFDLSVSRTGLSETSKRDGFGFHREVNPKSDGLHTIYVDDDSGAAVACIYKNSDAGELFNIAIRTSGNAT